MRLFDLYTSDFFKVGRYAPEFAAYAMQTFESCGPLVQAQQYQPVGSAIGAGKLGKVFEVISDVGGMSGRRELYGTVPSLVAGSNTKTVYMGINSELVVSDNMQNKALGTYEKDRQLKIALERLHYAMSYKMFNADTTLDDITDSGSQKSKYDFDGYHKYFVVNPLQEMSTSLNVADLDTNLNAKFRATRYLNEINAKINVNGQGADVIYTSFRGEAIFKSLSQDRGNYAGEYKFSKNVTTFDGKPVIPVPDNVIPADWKARGEFVLYVNQMPDFGINVMVPDNMGLITVYEDVKQGFTTATPIDLIFALVTANYKAAALGYFSFSAKSFAPSFYNYSILGTPEVGETLTAYGDYYDQDGNLPGVHLYQWAISDTVNGVYADITGATSSTYVVQAGDVGKFIRVKMTPVAQTGTPIGNQVTTASTPAIKE